MAEPINSLAPQSTNALIDRTRKYPEFREMSGYLGGAMPNFRYGEGAELMGASGKFNPLNPREVVLAERLGYDSNSGLGEETAIHELTHATMNKLHWAYQDALKNRKNDPAASQFVDAYEKLGLTPKYTSQAWTLANRIAPKWIASKAAAGASDRIGGLELPAWGMGLSATGRTDDYGSPPHLNPTLATEFRILLDLANKVKTK